MPPSSSSSSPDRPLPASPEPPPPPPLEYSPRRESPSLWDALKSITVEDLKRVHQVPCAREAFLAGIATGFAFAGVKLVLRGTIPSAANWAGGTFCGTSIVVYEACHLRRYREKQGMARAIEIMERQAKERGGKGHLRSRKVGEELVVAKMEGDGEGVIDPLQRNEAGRPRAEIVERAREKVGKAMNEESRAMVGDYSRDGGVGAAGGAGSDGGREGGGKSWWKFW